MSKMRETMMSQPDELSRLLADEAPAALVAPLQRSEKWWEQDSNLRRLSQRVYSPSPLTARESHRKRRAV